MRPAYKNTNDDGDSGSTVRELGMRLSHVKRRLRERLARERPGGLPDRVSAWLAGRLQTQRARHRKVLEREHDLLNAIIEGSGDMIAALDLDFRYLVFNRAYQAEFKRIFGSEIHPGERLDDIMSQVPEDRRCTMEMWGRAFRGEDFTATGELGDPGRMRRHYEMRFSPIRDREGRLIGAAQIVRDVTERKRTEDRLQETQLAVDRAADPIFWLDPGGRFLYVNDAACGSLGYTREELLGLSVPDIDPLFPAPAWAGHWRQIRERGSLIFESIHRRKSGETFPVEITVNHQQHNSGCEFAYAFVRDISRRKADQEALRRANAELARSNQELEQFASIVSHDLRSPMMTISGYVFLLGSHLGEEAPGEVRDALATIRSTIDQMNELLKGLLTYSRVGRGGLAISDCSLEAALRAALTNLSAELQASEAEVSHDPLPVVPADERLIVQLLQNLVGNALKYRGEGRPEVHVSACQDQGSWVVSVVDNGIGIEPEHRERIFGMFQRVPADESKYSGTGIGLAMCRKIVEQHGGQIWVEPNSPRGSVFRFTLPVSS